MGKIKLPQMNLKTNSERAVYDLTDDDESLADIVLALKNGFSLKGVSEEIQEVVKRCVEALPRQKGVQLAKHELRSLKENTSSTQLVSKSIQSREESLKSIHELNKYLKSNNWVQLKEVHLQCAELLHGHRLFTLNAIESIIKWKNFLSNSLLVNGQRGMLIECIFEGQNYLTKMRNDLDFLKNSEFAKILNFNLDHDPLLVAPSVPIGKIEKGRKRDANYFLDDGVVIVPIPSFMLSRVKAAEVAVFSEYEFCKFNKEFTVQKQAEIFAPKMLEEIIEEIVRQGVGEVSEGLESKIKEEKMTMKKNKKAEKEAKKIMRKLIEEEVSKNLELVLEEEIREARLLEKREEEQRLSEILIGNLVEEILKETSEQVLSDLQEELAEDERKNRKIREEVDDKIAKEIMKGFFDQVFLAVVEETTIETLKELRKNREEEAKIYMIKSALMEEIGLDFATFEFFADLEEMRWVPLKLPEELINDVLNEYYTISPEENHTILPDIENLLNECTKYADTCWYWAVKGTVILGFLVFSTDCFNKNGKKIIVHYVSSLYWGKYGEILDSAVELLWKLTMCDEIRLNLFVETGKDLTPDTKKIFTQLGFKWKTKYSLKDLKNDIIVLGKSKREKNTNPAPAGFSLNCYELLCSGKELKTEEISGKHLETIANRQNMLHGLLSLYGKLENASLKVAQKVQNKLQETINSLLSVMNSTQSFSFPSISDVTEAYLEEFLKTRGFGQPADTEKSCLSMLDLKFRWTSCTNSILSIKNKQVRYMRFKSRDLKCMKLADGIEIYNIPTELANVKAFFIKAEDLNESLSRTLSQKQDLFCFVEKITSDSADENISEIWVPSFYIKSCESLGWMTGYEITPQQESQDTRFVIKCFEDINLTMNITEIPEGLLLMNNKFGPVFLNDFIFGLFYSKGDKILDIPLFACKVKEENWITI